MELDFNEYQEHLIVVGKKAEFFFQKLQPVHVTYKKGFWRNGFIKEIGTDLLILDDFKEGETVIFFLEISDLEKFTPPTEVKG